MRSVAVFAPDGNNRKAVAAADSLTYYIEAPNSLSDWGARVVTEVTGAAAAAATQSAMTPPVPDAGWS